MPPCSRSRCVVNIDQGKRRQHASDAGRRGWSAELIATFGETGMRGIARAAVKNSIAGKRVFADFFPKKSIAPIRRFLDGTGTQL